MSHFTEEHFTKLGKTREQCIEVLSMNNERLQDIRNFDMLQNSIYGYYPMDKQKILDKQQEEALLSHRHTNKHKKWYRVIKTILRSTGLTTINDTMAKLMMESCKRKNERVTDANGVTTIIKSSVPVIYDPPAIFPIFKYIMKELTVGDNVSYGIFYEGVNLNDPHPKTKYKILIQNVFYTVKGDPRNIYKSILHSEKELRHGLMLRIEFDDVKELKGTVIILKADIIFIPIESYTGIKDNINLIPKTDELDDKKESRFVKELNEKAKKISKASLPTKEHTKQNILPRFK